ncbi:MAG: response regulator [bacterium]
MTSDYKEKDTLALRKTGTKEGEESKSILIAPLRVVAQIATISGLIMLLFEINYFAQYKQFVYSIRLAATAVAFIILVITNFTSSHRLAIILIHTLLLSIILSFGIIVFLIPDTLVLNAGIVSLIIFTVALFLSWDVKNQIIVAIYYNLVFAGSLLWHKKALFFLPGELESASFIIFLGIMAIVASMINYRIRRKLPEQTIVVEKTDDTFKDIFENAAEGIFQVTTEGTFIRTNSSFIKMLGFNSKHEMDNLNIGKDIFKDNSEFARLLKMLERQGKLKNYKFIAKQKDNAELILKMNARYVKEEGAPAPFIEGSLQDVTQQAQTEFEKKKLIESLKSKLEETDKTALKAAQASNVKSQFLANMSHEIRTPMNSVLGFLTLIENGLFESKDELKEFANNAKLSAESLLDIINNILDISKIEAGKMELDEKEFDLRDEIDKSISIIKPAAKEKGLRLHYEVEKDVPASIIGDPTRYRQIVLNLLGNAVKFTDEGDVGAHVSIMEKQKDHITIQTIVKDSGPGIPEEKIPLLFDPYSQINDNKKKDKRQGTGLGLVISKEFITLMGGEIVVKSQVGKGSIFKFTVRFKTIEMPDFETPKPIHEKHVEYAHKEVKSAEDKHAIEKPFTVRHSVVEPIESEIRPVEMKETSDEMKITQIPRTSKTKNRLLLVEDNPISQKVELKLLREVGYSVDAVSNAEEALKAIQTNSFDLVLMDIEMDGLDGIEATKKIRKLNGEVKEIPIIAVTAHSSMKDRERCIAAGMDDYIAKPININFFKMTIDKWLTENRVKL